LLSRLFPAGRSILIGSLGAAGALWLYHLALLRWMEATGSSLGALNTGWLVPLHAQARLDVSLWLIPALAVVSALLLASRCLLPGNGPPRAVLLAGAVATFVAVAVSVAMIDGYQAYGNRRFASLVLPYARTHLEYYGDVPQVDRVGGPAAFLAKFALPRLFTTLSLHSQTHPPGGILFLWVVGRLFGTGLWPAALATVAFGALMVLPVHGLGRELYGEEVARASLLLLTLMPNVLMYAATSMDGPFAVFAMLTLYLFYRGQRGGAGLWGGLMGLSLAVAAFMTYAVVFLPAFFAVLLLIAVRTMPGPRVATMIRTHLAGAVAFVAFYVALFLLTGYDAPGAVRAAMRHDAEMMGTGHEHLGLYLNISVANLASYAFGIGLPLAVAWVRQSPASVRRLGEGRQADAFVAAFGATLLLMAFSTLFTLEVERIWLFTAPFVVLPVASSLLAAGNGSGIATLRFVAGLLAFQLIVSEATIQTPW
jgi:hypothetical protein